MKTNIQSLLTTVETNIESLVADRQELGAAKFEGDEVTVAKAIMENNRVGALVGSTISQLRGVAINLKGLLPKTETDTAATPAQP